MNKEDLQRLIEDAKTGYADPSKVGDSEVLGRLVATWAEWDGTKILGAFLSALTEANLHGLREEIRQLVLEHGLVRSGDSVDVS
jgi:hypothetical protein